MKKFIFITLFYIAPFNLFASPNSHPLLTAQRISFDRTKQELHAQRNVLISYAGKWLKTSQLSFDNLHQVFHINSLINLYDANYGLMTGERAKLSSDFQNGSLEGIHIYLHQDKSTFSGARAQRIEGRYAIIEKATYSPCNICHTKKPFWQLKSQKIVWDGQQQNIIHRHAHLEVGGIPVFYIPYLSHPDPTVKRRSGFLSPSLQSGAETGAMFSTPYFWPINPYKDFTLTPFLGARAQIFKTRYRENFRRGSARLGGSIAHTGHRKTSSGDKYRLYRWHVDSQLKFHHNQHWRSNFIINRSSDPVYGKRFQQIDFAPTLSRSVAEAERFGKKDYLRIQMIAFQETKSSETSQNFPLVLPYVRYSLYETPFDDKYILFKYDTDFLTITRERGTNMSRCTNAFDLSKTWFSSTGFKFIGATSLRADIYWSEKVKSDLSEKTVNPGFKSRTLPQISLETRYPLVRTTKHTQITLTPLVKIIGAPNKKKEAGIPNEDSINIELDDTNLFLSNRFIGKDRLDDGSRAVYGTEAMFNAGENTGTLFLGQSYEMTKPDQSLSDTGFDRRQSDYILRGSMLKKNWIELTSKLRLRPKKLQLNRLDLSSKIGPSSRHISVRYTKTHDKKATFFEKGVEQLNISAYTELTEKWSAACKTILNLRDRQKTLQQAAEITYSNECFTAHFSLERSFFRDKDLKPGVSGMIRLSFKNLGNISHKRKLSTDQNIPVKEYEPDQKDAS